MLSSRGSPTPAILFGALLGFAAVAAAQPADPVRTDPIPASTPDPTNKPDAKPDAKPNAKPNAAATTKGPPPVAGVILASFDEWDLNRNGAIEPPEADRLVVEPAFRGEQAAALAAIKLAVRSTKSEPAPITRELLQSTPSAESPKADPVLALELEDQAAGAAPRTRPLLTSAQTLSGLQSRYARGLRRIRSAKRELFLDETPDIDRCRQGSLGDCFLIAGVGAYAHRNPQDVRSMIRTVTGGYIVTFGVSQSIRVNDLTDAQICLTSSTGDEGLWLAIIEQAYGTLRNQNKPIDQQTEEATDAIARGGSIASTITALTGHAVQTTSMRPRLEKARDKQEAIEPILVQIRAELARAQRDRRLAGCGTGSTDTGSTLPPGIPGKHAYAVIAFDEARGVVTLWNPHGNTFKPKGEPGISNGYPTAGGRFELPVTDFAWIFRGLTVETDHAPVPRKKPAAKPAA